MRDSIMMKLNILSNMLKETKYQACPQQVLSWWRKHIYFLGNKIFQNLLISKGGGNEKSPTRRK